VSGVAVSLIAAVAANGVIGKDGGMPWRLSTDMRRFKALTMGKPVIMGRRTFESIGKPLAGRLNIVVTRQAAYRPEGAAVAASPEAALAMAKEAARAAGVDEVFVIGGGELYAATLPLADRLYITHVEATPSGDTRFPTIDPRAWAKVSDERFPAGEKDSAATAFTVYHRRRDRGASR
jgi:dihydrofolate reductase